MPNPKLATIDANNKTIERLQDHEELEAMCTIITTRPLAGGFYGLFFLLLMSLELFGVFSKMVDSKYDYEATITG